MDNKDYMNKLEQLAAQKTLPLFNNLYNGSYKYTLMCYRDTLKKLVTEHNLHIDEKLINMFLLEKMHNEYIPHIKKRIDIINSIPVVEQKSPEWFMLREDMISASDAGYFLKKCGASKALDALKIKVGIKNYINSNAPPLIHGNTYEDVSRAIYESRNGVKICEHGILPSIIKYIGASPDGIVVECLNNTFECQSKYGRLLEIKNPYSREIDNNVKPEYMVQILQQQYTTCLPVCDFVETTIVDKYCKSYNPNYKPYETLLQMLNDKLDTSNPKWKDRIKNTNIPYENLNKFGNEKGLIIWYQKKNNDNDIRNKYIIYPLQNKYDEMLIEKWITDTNAEQFINNFIHKEIKYWRLDVYSEKTVVYDQHIYENEYIPKLSDVWNIISKCRTLNKHHIEKYIDELETIDDNPFYNENKKKRKVQPQKTFIFENNDIELDF